MRNWRQYILPEKANIRNGLERLDELGENHAVLFIVDDKDVLLGSVTDGDIRRGLIKNAALEDEIACIANKNFRRIINGNFEFEYIKECKELGITVLPNIDDAGKLKGIIDLQSLKTTLPLHAVVMAGGKGERLMPLTKHTPKPMLKVGNKPIIEHNIDRLISYGVKNIHISINYLGHLISDYFKDGGEKGIRIKYLQELEPLGTLGSISLVDHFDQDHVLVMNSDLLTNIDFEDFYNKYLASDADMAVATIPYHVDLPYAVMELNGSSVTSFKEKPRYTYFTNAGIYLIKKDQLSSVPKNKFFNATDLMELMLKENKKLVNYPIYGYWLDIGKPEDFSKAQVDIQRLTL